MKTLVIAEKNSVAGEIAEALGGGFTRHRDGDGSYYENSEMVIAPAVGHLVMIECPKAEDPGYDLSRLPAIPQKFSLTAIPRTEGQLKVLSKLLMRSDIELVVNACDAGREGELIFRYIYIYAQCRKSVARMWIQSMTTASIMSAYADMRPGTEFDPLFAAAQSRSEADWLIGINGTRAVSILNKLMHGGRERHSVGRVQTPVLNIVVERDDAIKTFVAKEYFEVHAEFADTSRHYKAKWINPRYEHNPANKDAKAERIFDRNVADQIISKCRGHHPSSVTDVCTELSTPAPKLFDLTTLQREANTRIGFSAKHTLDTAQKLYDSKIITYPRTDADALPEDYLDTTVRTLQKIADAGGPLSSYAGKASQLVQPNKRIFNNAKISDHFAIIPSGTLNAGLAGDEAKLFDLILRRFIAAFYPPAIHSQTIRTTLINGEQFKASGKVLVNEGWLAVYGAEIKEGDDADDQSPSLCRMNSGEVLPVRALTTAKLKTTKPKPYTEATLLSAMETAGQEIEDEAERDALKGKGLGTPATRAATIEKLLDPETNYLKREGKYIRSTTKGGELIAFLRQQNLGLLLSAKTTGEWEYKFKQMEKGAFTRAEFMRNIEALTRSIIDIARGCVAALPAEKQIAATPQQTKTLSAPCPKCAKHQVQLDDRAATCACGFRLWREIASYKLTEIQICALLQNGELSTITGFISGKKKPFSAKLKLSGEYSGKVDFVFN